jgi:hypothetical protein
MRMKRFVHVFAGHSLGEYSTLFSIADVLHISALVGVVFYHGITMQHVVERDLENHSNYAMCAVNPTFSNAPSGGYDLERILARDCEGPNKIDFLQSHCLKRWGWVWRSGRQWGVEGMGRCIPLTLGFQHRNSEIGVSSLSRIMTRMLKIIIRWILLLISSPEKMSHVPIR